MPDASPPLTTLPGTGANESRTTVNEIEMAAESTNIQTVSLISTTLLTSKPATPNGDNQHLNTGTDNVPHTIKHPSVTCSTPVTSASISGCESYLASESAHCGPELNPCTTTKGTTLSTKKIVTSHGMDTISLGPPLTPVTIASLHGSFAERTSNVVLSANYNPNDHQQLIIDGRTTAGAVEPHKNVNVSLSTSSSSVANGFVCTHSSVSSSAAGKSLLNVSPHSGNKVLPIPSNTVVGSAVVAASTITKTSVSTGTSSVGAAGSSLVFHGAAPLMSHSSAGLPMLIQATPYRSPFPNYSTLYTPYNNITHGQYLPSVISMGNSNTSSLSQRSDNRSCRETQPMTSLKMPVTSASTLNQQSANIAGLRPITPLGYMISNNSTTQVLGTIPITTTTVPSLHSTQSHLLPAAFNTSAPGPPISTTQLSTSAGITVVTSQTQPCAPILPQTGYQSHVPQVINSYPQFAHSTSTTQQSLLRCTTTSTISTSNTTVLTVQSLITATPSPSINTSVAPSSVIQKILSPKIDSRDRETSY
ncbi:PREDICTED: mucin-5AC-like, partial [Drosophila arizonae]|uniref:Mucin-5AC-like n=1 Tax=Drosophila arizonae TaxID=7263 RepID=A0ABM1Q053_DROAR